MAERKFAWYRKWR